MTTTLSKTGKEQNNPKKARIPLGCSQPESLTSQIQRLIRGQMSETALNEGRESFDEANDFDIEDDFDTEEMLTKHNVMQEEFLNQLPEDADIIEKEPEPGRDNSGSEAPKQPDKLPESEKK